MSLEVEHYIESAVVSGGESETRLSSTILLFSSMRVRPVTIRHPTLA